MTPNSDLARRTAAPWLPQSQDRTSWREEQDQRPVRQRAGTLRYMGPLRPGPLRNRPLGDKPAIPANGTTMTSMCSRMGPWSAASLLFTGLGSRQGYQSESLGAPQAGPSRRDQNRGSSPSCATQPLASMGCSRLAESRQRSHRAVCSQCE
jgi:hypothetical protein